MLFPPEAGARQAELRAADQASRLKRVVKYRAKKVMSASIGDDFLGRD